MKKVSYTEMKNGTKEDYLFLEKHEKKSENMELSNSIKPQPNSLVASLQSNLSFHDVNPVTKIEGSRNACYIAISSNNKIWKSIEDNKFNQRFHKNRVEKKSIVSKFKNIFR